MIGPVWTSSTETALVLACWAWPLAAARLGQKLPDRQVQKSDRSFSSAQRASSTADAGRHQVQQSSSVSCCCYPMRFYSITTMRCCQNIKSHLPERDSDDTTAGTLSCQVPSNRACRLAESKSISLESGHVSRTSGQRAATRAARRLGRCECGGTRRRPDR